MKLEKQFTEIKQLINKAKANAFKVVNTELINLYWEIGKYISIKISKNLYLKLVKILLLLAKNTGR